jgi:Flp pilus assembly protein TadG
MGIRKIVRRLVEDRRGAVVVETALVLPMLLVTMAGLIDGGRAILTQMQLQAAAQAAADRVRADAGDLAKAEDAADGATPLVVTLDPAPVIQDGCATRAGITPAKKGKDACGGGRSAGTFVIVTAQASFAPIMPWPGLGAPGAMHATAAVRID